MKNLYIYIYMYIRGTKHPSGSEVLLFQSCEGEDDGSDGKVHQVGGSGYALDKAGLGRDLLIYGKIKTV